MVLSLWYYERTIIVYAHGVRFGRMGTLGLVRCWMEKCFLPHLGLQDAFCLHSFSPILILLSYSTKSKLVYSDTNNVSK